MPGLQSSRLPCQPASTRGPDPSLAPTWRRPLPRAVASPGPADRLPPVSSRQFSGRGPGMRLSSDAGGRGGRKGPSSPSHHPLGKCRPFGCWGGASPNNSKQALGASPWQRAPVARRQGRRSKPREGVTHPGSPGEGGRAGSRLGSGTATAVGWTGEQEKGGERCSQNGNGAAQPCPLVPGP